MIDYRDEIRALIDPERARQLPDGRHVQDISVVMIDYPGRCSRGEGRWQPPSALTLTPDRAREFARELLDYAEIAERIGERR
jgi:hypothetical protein